MLICYQACCYAWYFAGLPAGLNLTADGVAVALLQVTIKPPPTGLTTPFTLYVSSNIGGRITAQTTAGRRLRQLL